MRRQSARRGAFALAAAVAVGATVLLILGGCSRDPGTVQGAGTGGNRFAAEPTTANGRGFEEEGTSTASAQAARASGRARAAAPLSVEAVEITSGRLLDGITVSGRIRGIRETTVVSQTTGIIRNASVTLGMPVKTGTVLVAMDDSIQKLNLEEAEARYESARLRLDSTRRLHESGNASAVELAEAKAQAAGARAAVERARERLDERAISAPIDGRVASVPAEISAGNRLQPGSRVARIVNLSTLEMEVAVGEREVSFLEEGTPAEVSTAVCSEPQMGEITGIAAGNDPQSGSFPVLVRWENRCDGEIRSGMSATARLEASQGNPRLLTVPTSVVLNDDGQDYVFVADRERGIARRVAVKVGETLGAKTAVRTGLSGGELVITSGLSRLKDGDRISVTVTGTSGGMQ